MSQNASERQVPLALIVVGLALYAVGAMMHSGSQGVAAVLPVVIVGGMIQTILMILAAFVVASMLKVSFGDFRSAALKFAGAALASGGLGAVIPLGGLLAALVFLCLIIWLFELEVSYAAVFTVIYFVLALLVGIGVRSALA